MAIVLFESDGVGQRHELRRPELPTVVCCIAAQEDESVGGRAGAGQRTEMTDAVTGAVEEVHRPVLEVVVCGEVADFDDFRFLKSNLKHFAAPISGKGFKLVIATPLTRTIGDETHSTSLGRIPPNAELPSPLRK